MGVRVARDTRNCYDRPREYKFCQSGACILNNDYCPCNSDLFQCSNGKCIHPSLVCNKRNDCGGGNNSDEQSCVTEAASQEGGAICNISIGTIVGISIGAIILVTLCVVLVVYWIQRKKRLQLQNTSSLEPLRISVKVSTDINSSEGSDAHTKNSGYNKVPLDDSFGPFNDALCTSTPKSDARREIIRTKPSGPTTPPIIILKGT